MSIHLNSTQMRQRYGNISQTTMWRWTHDPEMGFPQPRRINGRLYFAVDDLDAFDRRHARAGAVG